MTDDPFDLDRFLAAQRGVYDQALAEIRAGAKRSHWMWFIFPQIAGLGHSPMARLYAIGSPAEARAFIAYPLLGARYRACVAALQALPDADAGRVFGAVDALKLRSSLTLFAEVSGEPLLIDALHRWGGTPDPETQRRLRDG